MESVLKAIRDELTKLSRDRARIEAEIAPALKQMADIDESIARLGGAQRELQANAAPAVATSKKNGRPAKTGVSGKIREFLYQNGPKSAPEIAQAVGLKTSQIRSRLPVTGGVAKAGPALWKADPKWVDRRHQSIMATA